MLATWSQQTRQVIVRAGEIFTNVFRTLKGLLSLCLGGSVVLMLVFLCAGTSSFGMSGVNAHLLLTAQSRSAPTLQRSMPLPWQRQRFWPAPLLSAMLAAHLPSSVAEDHVTQLVAQPGSRQGLAFLWDHRVQGRVLLPGTAMFELAAAAAAALTADGALPGAMQPMLAALSIISPKVLSGLAQHGTAVQANQQAAAASDTMLCEVDAVKGQLRIVSAPQGPAAAAAPAHLKSDIVLANGPVAVVSDRSKPAPQRQLQSLHKTLQQAAGFAIVGSSRSAVGHTIAQPQLHAAAAAASADSFIMHPAVADAVLHLGAVHVDAGSSRVSRVPVGVAAYSCSRHGPATDRFGSTDGVVSLGTLVVSDRGRHPEGLLAMASYWPCAARTFSAFPFRMPDVTMVMDT